MTSDAVRPPAGSGAHLLVEDVELPDLDADGWHHLVRVRRQRAGDTCTVTDGRGRWRESVLVPTTSPSSLRIEPTGPVVTVPAPDPGLTVAFALTKSDKPDLVIQKLTELGVDRIVPFRAARSVVRWDAAKAESHRARWVTIAQRAVEQSRRVWMPEIGVPVDTATLVGLGAVRVDRGGRAPRSGDNVYAVGPEGGWDDAERAQLPDAVTLGPHVLRAETAALTVGVLGNALRSGVVSEYGQMPR